MSDRVVGSGGRDLVLLEVALVTGSARLFGLVAVVELESLSSETITIS